MIHSLWYRFVQWVTRLFFHLRFKIEVRGLEYIPQTGAVIIACNHISYFDPPAIGAFVRRQIYFFAKEELFRNFVVGALLRSLNAFPVRREENDVKALRTSLEVLKRGGGLVLFPEGARQTDGQLGPARPGLGLMAAKANVPVVPAYITFQRQKPYLVLAFGPPLILTEQEKNERKYQDVSNRVREAIALLRTKMIQ